MERGTERMEEALQKKQNHGGRENEFSDAEKWCSRTGIIDWK